MASRFYGTLTNPLYVPAVINILSISNANPAVIVTTYDGLTAAANDYINGLRYASWCHSILACNRSMV